MWEKGSTNIPENETMQKISETVVAIGEWSCQLFEKKVVKIMEKRLIWLDLEVEKVFNLYNKICQRKKI